nr:MAG TPA: helix-turn-helix domain protein [Caudoviricetes sp.]
MDVSRQRLYEFRKDPACMSVDQLKKMADILGVEFADMYNLREAYQNETKEDL